MIFSDANAKDYACPIASHASRARRPCMGSACAWWRWHSADGLSAENYSIQTSVPVGGCSIAGVPSSQHLLVAASMRPGPRSTLGNGLPVDAGKLNTGARTLLSGGAPAPKPAPTDAAAEF